MKRLLLLMCTALLGTCAFGAATGAAYTSACYFPSNNPNCFSYIGMANNQAASIRYSPSPTVGTFMNTASAPTAKQVEVIDSLTGALKAGPWSNTIQRLYISWAARTDWLGHQCHNKNGGNVNAQCGYSYNP